MSRTPPSVSIVTLASIQEAVGVNGDETSAEAVGLTATRSTSPAAAVGVGMTTVGIGVKKAVDGAVATSRPAGTGVAHAAGIPACLQ